MTCCGPSEIDFQQNKIVPEPQGWFWVYFFPIQNAMNALYLHYSYWPKAVSAVTYTRTLCQGF